MWSIDLDTINAASRTWKMHRVTVGNCEKSIISQAGAVVITRKKDMVR